MTSKSGIVQTIPNSRRDVRDNCRMNTPSRNIPLAVVDGAASLEPGARQVADQKIARSPVQFADVPVLRKPSWIRVRIPSGNAVQALKSKLRENRLVTVCEAVSYTHLDVYKRQTVARSIRAG